MPKPKQSSTNASQQAAANAVSSKLGSRGLANNVFQGGADIVKPVLENLEVLHLG